MDISENTQNDVKSAIKRAEELLILDWWQRLTREIDNQFVFILNDCGQIYHRYLTWEDDYSEWHDKTFWSPCFWLSDDEKYEEYLQWVYDSLLYINSTKNTKHNKSFWNFRKWGLVRLTSDYLTYRGKCKELCLQAIKENPDYQLVRGYYHCAIWGRQEHWWCVKPNGEIHDPSIKQFPDRNGEYEEFDGYFNCETCGKQITEEEGTIYGRYIFCSYECIGACVL